MDDCLRCHGMHFDGAMRDLVQPQNTTGPWHITRAELPTAHHALPWPATRSIAKARPNEALPRASPSPAASATFACHLRPPRANALRRRPACASRVSDGPRAVKISPDPRQALCYQCHAPRQPEPASAATNHWGPQVGSGDDRTPMGVHEGLSCFACHSGHNENALASCKLPVTRTCPIAASTSRRWTRPFANAKSSHNIHWVKCADCHQHGVPKLKAATQTINPRTAIPPRTAE